MLSRADCQLRIMTIVALSSGPGRAGVAVIRVSGPAAGTALERVAGPRPVARTATRARLRHPRTGEVLDQGLVLWFPGPASYTSEDVAEFHVHGGTAVVAGVTDALLSVEGVRPAEPGEFTRRAFLHGKMDLIQAEAVADLIEAETEAQRSQSLRQLGGELGGIYERWRATLIGVLAHLEAEIDFPEEDLPAGLLSRIRSDVAGLVGELEGHLADGRCGERLREGLYVVIAGPPNVGKSSLLNRLARRDAAIVSARAGTTRDVIEVHLDLGGYPVILADTAGLRCSEDEIESEGVRRARARAEDADLRILMLDAASWPEIDGEVGSLIDDDALIVINKIDMHPVPGGVKVEGREAWPMSVATGEGLEAFLGSLEKAMKMRFGRGEAPVITRARHRKAVEECTECLKRFLSATENYESTNARIELITEDVRLAGRTLGRITGRIDVEDLLDVVFRDFCIGK